VIVEAIGIGEPERWRETLVGVRHEFAHTWEYCRAQHERTGQSVFLFCAHGDGARVACSLVEQPINGGLDLVTPPGFSGFAGNRPLPSLPSAWRNFVADRGYITGFIGLNPLFGDDSYVVGERVWPNKHVYVLDLTIGSDELFRRLSTNRRRQLRRWVLAGHVDDRERLTAFFVRHYADFMARKGGGSDYAYPSETLEALCRSPNVFLLGAVDEQGNLEAAVVFGVTPHVADYLFGVSLPDAAHHSAGLLWSAVHRLRENHIPLLNLGGGLAAHDSLAEFKSRFGAQELPLACLKQVYRPTDYERLCVEHGGDPADLSGFFPAYRARQESVVRRS
jgi:hypothetical protein